MGKRFTVTVTESGNTFTCGEDQPVLYAMIHAGSGPIHQGCCGGGCGVCRMKIQSGSWQAFKPMSRAHVSEADEKEGIVLLCCVQPRSSLVVARAETNMPELF
jgi:ferredoxin